MIKTRRNGDIKLLSLVEAKELSDRSDLIIIQIEPVGSNIKEPWFLVEFVIKENIDSSNEKKKKQSEIVADFKPHDYVSCDFGDPDHVLDKNLCYTCNNFDRCLATKTNVTQKIYKCTDFSK